MPRVLILDDEPRYQQHLTKLLTRRDFEVLPVSSPSEAISSCIQFRPDVLITDWLLNDERNGIQVSRAMQVIHPFIQTIIITGFCSKELKHEAEENRIFAVLEKPFSPQNLTDAVDDALKATQEAVTPRVAVVEADDRGSILFANPKARELFSQTLAGEKASHLFEVFSAATLEAIDESQAVWVEAPPQTKVPTTWCICSRRYDDKNSRQLFFYPRDEAISENDLLACMLLGVTSIEKPLWPLDARVLLIADDEIVRFQITDGLQQTGCFCHTAVSLQEGYQLFKRDPGIRVIIFNCSLTEPDRKEALVKFRRMRSDVVLVDPSGKVITTNFHPLSPEQLKENPWSPEKLIQNLYHEETPQEISTETAEQLSEQIPLESPIGIVNISAEGGIVCANRSFQKMLGYSEMELHNMFVTDITDLQNLELDAKLLVELVSGQRNYYRIRKRCYRKNGETFNAVWTAFSIGCPCEDVPCFVGLLEEENKPE